MTSSTVTAVNNVTVAERLGLSRAAVSRYRNGSRAPRIATMTTIAREYGWTVADQAEANSRGEWAEGFEAALCQAYGPSSHA